MPSSNGARLMVSACDATSIFAGADNFSAAGWRTRMDFGRGAGYWRDKKSPSAARAAKGTRNLIEAANHSQKRKAAPLLRNARVSNQAAPANRVDCQR